VYIAKAEDMREHSFISSAFAIYTLGEQREPSGPKDCWLFWDKQREPNNPKDCWLFRR